MRMSVKGKVFEDVKDVLSAVNTDEALMELKDDRWIVKAVSGGQEMMVAILVPGAAMQDYDREGYEEIGVDLNKIVGFIRDSDQEIDMYMEDRAIHLDDGKAHARIASIVPDAVQGHTDMTPNIEHEIKIIGSFEFISDFCGRIEDIINAEAYYFGAREEGVHMYASGDNGEVHEHYSWEDYSGYDIDWEVNNPPEPGGHTPKDDHAIDVILDRELSQDIIQVEDEATISLGNHIPMKVAYDTSTEDDEGIKISFFQMPRIDQQEHNRIPDKVFE